MADGILVLGATGFLGAAVCRALAEDGYAVTAPVRTGRRLPEGLEGLARRIDVPPDAAGYIEALAGAQPAAVVDASWEGVAGGARGDAHVQQRNIDRTGALLERLDLSCARIWVGLGSQAEYGPIDGVIDERHPLRPTTAYGRAKIEVARLLDEALTPSGVAVAWLRVFASYGPGQEPGWLVRDALARLMRDEPVPLTSGRQGCDYLYVDDVARAARALINCPGAEGAYNVGSGTAVAVRDLVATAKEVCGSSSPLLFGALPDPAGPVTAWAADTSRLRRDTSWRPRTSLRNGLAATVAWLRDRDATDRSGGRSG